MTSLSRISAVLITALFVALPSTEAAARCDIVDVLELVKDGESRANIRLECDNVVDDAPGCSLTKVMRYAKDRYSERQISQRCQSAGNTRSVNPQPAPAPRRTAPQIARFCTTPLGACPMMIAIPSGSRCHCAMPYGPVFGVAR